MVEQSGIRRRGKEPGNAAKESDETHHDWVEEKVAKDDQVEKPVDDAKANNSEEMQRLAEVNAANGLTLATALRFMEKEEFVGAVPVLEKLLEQMPEDGKDPVCLHNLAVCFERLGDLQKAEEIFWDAATVYEKQLKSEKATPEQKSSLGVYQTTYGLASVMTRAHNGNSCKLLQAEVLLRDLLEKSQERDDMIDIMYRSYVTLAENVSMQKKWDLAAQAYEQSVALGKAFKLPAETIHKHEMMLAHAEKLARYQKYLRIVMWTVALIMLIVTLWYAFFRDSSQATEGHLREHTRSHSSGLIGALSSILQ